MDYKRLFNRYRLVFKNYIYESEIMWGNRNLKKKKAKKQVVLYKTEEFANMGIKYITDCPFGVCANYTGQVIKVGGDNCNRCEYQDGNYPGRRTVVCRYQKQEEEKVKSIWKDEI